jgi:hypothetical protein
MSDLQAGGVPRRRLNLTGTGQAAILKAEQDPAGPADRTGGEYASVSTASEAPKIRERRFSPPAGRKAAVSLAASHLVRPAIEAKAPPPPALCGAPATKPPPAAPGDERQRTVMFLTS